MSRKRDDIRKQIERRRREYRSNRTYTQASSFDYDEVQSEAVFESDPEELSNSIHPLWNRDVFFMKLLGAAILVLVTAIVFQTPTSNLDGVRVGMQKAMEKEFQFAAVADWYETTFGQPLALLPPMQNEEKQTESAPNGYATPASGKVLEHFTDDARGVMIETKMDEQVEAMAEGVIVFAGKKDNLGQTVIIQHPDYSESWYGKLEEVFVKPREKISAGTPIGIVSHNESASAGEFYFAIKREDTFIDPIQVMKFE